MQSPFSRLAGHSGTNKITGIKSLAFFQHPPEFTDIIAIYIAE